MNLDFTLGDFSGPLDLLLHLIKENKMDILNIEIEKLQISIWIILIKWKV